ncbi:MAG: flagellar M-ring protein FliF [Alphaproteobacteria bacterium CG11_big_fil_rev_8_21_14_0_20_44_7]|nr:MAG: flagellar M-ring protein FliF [Alphaproteobacteria bacterium CG11_big_fil_rev_8_21_14_0_20_44_7]
MNEILEPIKKLGIKKLMIMAGAGVAVIVAILIATLTAGNGSHAPLYTNLSLEDSQRIVTELESRAVPYSLGANGTQILVPAEQIMRLRMVFAEQGLPSTEGATIGYEIFDKSDKLGTSSFVQNMNQLRALEGELARTIASINQVKSARVHLVIPKRELFKKDRNVPTASIQISMNGSEKLSGGEVAAVRYLVATAVPGLNVENITVIDDRGLLLARGGEDENDPAMFASNAQEYKTGYENKVRLRIEELLEKFVGMGNVKAQVSAEIDFDRVVTNSETYDPEGQVARSIQTTEESETSAGGAGGNVSVANNLPDGSAGAGGGGGDKREKIDEVTNYEISKTVKNHVSETGKVNKLSIAVLIDGIYETDEESGEIAYKERDEAELNKLEELIKSAVGFDEERGDSLEITNLPFSPDFGGYQAEGMLDWLKQDLQSVVQILVMGLVAILVVMMVVRPLVKRALEINLQHDDFEADQPQLLTGPGGAMMRIPGGIEGGGESGGFLGGGDEESEGLAALTGLKNRSKPSSIKKMNEIIDQNPNDALTALRLWMYGENI